MAQFDVHRLGVGIVVNCQSDLLDQIHSRFVVPLVRQSDVPRVAAKLNPIFVVDGVEYIMLTQAAAAVRKRELGDVVGSLAERSFEVTGALDVLLNGV